MANVLWVHTAAALYRRVGLCCGSGSRGPRYIHAFNGTARPEHGADVAVFVTNRGFTQVTRDFAARHDICLIDRGGLRTWATWGDQLVDILGVFVPANAGGAS